MEVRSSGDMKVILLRHFNEPHGLFEVLIGMETLKSFEPLFLKSSYDHIHILKELFTSRTAYPSGLNRMGEYRHAASLLAHIYGFTGKGLYFPDGTALLASQNIFPKSTLEF